MLARRRLRALATLTLAGALLTACTQPVTGTPQAASNTPATSTAPSSSASSFPKSTPTYPPVTVPETDFSDCTSILSENNIPVEAALKGKLTLGCAAVEVPLDYTRPTGTKIKLTVLKIHDSENTHSTGSLLVNPGGPGGSGLDLALGLLSNFPASVMQHFDMIGFDPRGVGESTPITCASNKEKDAINAASPDMSTTAGFNDAKELAKVFDDDCVKDKGSELPYFNTENTARDMDLIRQAVGDDQMNYLGFSYGTELGAAYAHLFPSKVRVAVLDGAVDPLTNGVQQFADQLKGFEEAFDQFAAYCPTSSTCNSLADPRATAESIEAAALASPLSTGSSRKLTASLASTGILQALYSRSLWPSLAAALIAGKSGDGSKLLALADQYTERSSDGTYTNIADANTAISCNDTPAGTPTDATIRATAAKWTTEYPLFGKWAAISLFSCQQWQPNRLVPPKPTAPTPTKVLVIGNLHDPATPYQGAKDLTTTMGNAELLSWDGEGHTSYLEGSSCVDDYVNNYLISEKLPPANTTCPK
ncbi:alpha/beta hydrolase [Jatrophihabitans sp.]|uniref:alpha/beta hydrolase n=1 Tax=Jatrophihabitans sp. TaxID=1932789 RepID=UPI0030C7796D